MAKAKPSVGSGMRYSHKHGKMVKVDPKRSASARKAAKGRKGKARSAATKKKIALGVAKAARTGKNRFGMKVRKWGRPAGSKSSRPRKEVKSSGKKMKADAPKRMRKAKEEAPKRGRKPKMAEAPKRGRGRPRKEEVAVKKPGRPKADKTVVVKRMGRG